MTKLKKITGSCGTDSDTIVNSGKQVAEYEKVER